MWSGSERVAEIVKEKRLHDDSELIGESVPVKLGIAHARVGSFDLNAVDGAGVGEAGVVAGDVAAAEKRIAERFRKLSARPGRDFTKVEKRSETLRTANQF